MSYDGGSVQQQLAAGAKFFGLAELPRAGRVVPERAFIEKILPKPGTVTLITGGSGSGKSTLLRAVVELPTGRKLEIGRQRFQPTPVLSQFGREGVEAAISRLARVGLAEAGLLGRMPGELSEGERCRLDLCKVFARAERGRKVLIFGDEFTSTLDEVTAVAVASAVRRSLDQHPQTAVLLATWREELARYLRPAIHVHCDYGTWEILATRSATCPPG